LKSYKEIAEMLEKHIDIQMKNPQEALLKDVAYAMEMWNTSVVRADEEKEIFSLEEKEKSYIKMLEYAERLMEPALNTPNKFGSYRGMYVFHIYTTMKGNIEELLGHTDNFKYRITEVKVKEVLKEQILKLQQAQEDALKFGPLQEVVPIARTIFEIISYLDRDSAF